MTDDQIKAQLLFIEGALRNNKDIIIEINRTQPDVIWENGFAERVPTWIEETITIKSKFYYDPAAPIPIIPKEAIKSIQESPPQPN